MQRFGAKQARERGDPVAAGVWGTGRRTARARSMDDTQRERGFPGVCSGCVRSGEARRPRDAQIDVGADAEAHGRTWRRRPA